MSLSGNRSVEEAAYEAGRARLAQLAAEEPAARARNEAMTRLQLIDTLFFDCLGWDRCTDVEVEGHYEGEYADYIFKAPRPRLVVEAKREGVTFEIPAGLTQRERTLSSLMADNVAFAKAIHQVAGYCTDRGIPLACACNGRQLVAFLAARDDGVPWRDGRVLVFSGFEQMLDHFRELWDALSRPAVERWMLDARLVGDTSAAPPPPLSATIKGYPGLRRRDEEQALIETLAPIVLTNAAESDALAEDLRDEWYVSTKALERQAGEIRTALQARYDAPFDLDSPTPVLEHGERLGRTIREIGGRPVLLLGDTGTGKSTLLRRIVDEERKAAERPLFAVHVDLGADAVGEANMREVVIARVADVLRQEHGVDVDASAFVRALYRPELERLAAGVEGELRDIDPPAYRKLEIERLLALKANRLEHVRRAVTHLVSGAELSPAPRVVLILDNADQRLPSVQREAFLTAQSLASTWPVAVVLAMRPDTFHASRRSGVLAAYHAHAFGVVPPPIRRVIERRVAFALRLARGELVLPFLQHVRVNVPTLATVLAHVRWSLRDVEQLREFIEAMASGNVRVALEALIDLVTSPHTDVRQLLEWADDRKAPLRLYRAVRAVALREHQYYSPAASRIANLFAISGRDGREHFLVPLLLSWLATNGESRRSGFAETGAIYDALQSLGFSPRQVARAIVRASDAALIETGTRETDVEGVAPSSYRVRDSAVYHVRELLRHFEYVDAVVVDTSILDDDTRAAISDVRPFEARIDRAQRFRQYLNTQWALLPYAAREVFDWTAISERLGESIENSRTRHLAVTRTEGSATSAEAGPRRLV